MSSRQQGIILQESALKKHASIGIAAYSRMSFMEECIGDIPADRELVSLVLHQFPFAPDDTISIRSYLDFLCILSDNLEQEEDIHNE